jgi:hypothetical protein
MQKRRRAWHETKCIHCVFVCRFVRLASGDEEKIREGRTSYPSGHAAETTMTFGLLSFYLMARLHLFTRQSQVCCGNVRNELSFLSTRTSHTSHTCQ